jgi:hypothetical protein
MKVLGIDIGETRVKLIVTGEKGHSEFASSPGLMMPTGIEIHSQRTLM